MKTSLSALCLAFLAGCAPQPTVDQPSPVELSNAAGAKGDGALGVAVDFRPERTSFDFRVRCDEGFFDRCEFRFSADLPQWTKIELERAGALPRGPFGPTAAGTVRGEPILVQVDLLELVTGKVIDTELLSLPISDAGVSSHAESRRLPAVKNGDYLIRVHDPIVESVTFLFSVDWE